MNYFTPYVEYARKRPYAIFLVIGILAVIGFALWLYYKGRKDAQNSPIKLPTGGKCVEDGWRPNPYTDRLYNAITAGLFGWAANKPDLELVCVEMLPMCDDKLVLIINDWKLRYMNKFSSSYFSNKKYELHEAIENESCGFKLSGDNAFTCNTQTLIVSKLKNLY